MEPVVHLRAAVALLGRFPALAGIDLDVARGEIVLLRGPNGAGKTTVLRACAGLVPVVRGGPSCWDTTCAWIPARCGATSACWAMPPACSTT
jgi:ABC-type branched-subunit amino acid transport system ATPase component